MKPQNATRTLLAMLLLLVPLLSSCGWLSTRSATAVACPAIPEAPAISEPAPSPSYLETALSVIEGWRKKLTDTPATPAR